MRILKSDTYINEKLDITPVTKTRLSGFLKKPVIYDEKIKDYIEWNGLKWNPILGGYDCDSDITPDECIVSDGKLLIKFGHVKGNFDCDDFPLTTLEGAPREVDGNFYCIGIMLTSLEGAPKKVGGNFDCNSNNLTTLEGAPNKVGGGFYCNDNNLTTLDGAPKEVDGGFYCSGNPNLVLPKEKPSWLKGKIIS